MTVRKRGAIRSSNLRSYELGKQAGAREERERHERAQQQEEQEPERLTMGDIRRMSAEEINERWEEVSQAMEESA